MGRGSGLGGASGIRISDIKAWLEIYEIADSKEFVHLIYLMDREYLRLQSERQERAEKHQQKKEAAATKNER
jgi:hypothetical protein